MTCAAGIPEPVLQGILPSLVPRASPAWFRCSLADLLRSPGSSGAIPCFAPRCFAQLCFALLRFASLCLALLNFAWLCLALLCFASLGFAVFCFAFQCFQCDTYVSNVSNVTLMFPMWHLCFQCDTYVSKVSNVTLMFPM